MVCSDKDNSSPQGARGDRYAAGFGSTEFDPSDEFMHEPTDHPQFNESMYFNFVDGASGFATLIRMGNRVNEGFAEVTVLLYLPGGGSAFHFERAEISSNDAFDAGGLRFRIEEPFHRSRVTFSGEVRVMAHGSELENPKTVFSRNPLCKLDLDLTYTDTIPVYGLGSTGSGESGIAGAENTIAIGHYQGPGRVTGSVCFDGEAQSVQGLGYRDHSWGPRIWQGPAWWRWICGLADERNGFVGWLSRIGDKVQPPRGIVLRDGEVLPVEAMELRSTYGIRIPHYPEAMSMVLTAGGKRFAVNGRAKNFVPLRNRRGGEVARLAELVCEYEFEGMIAHGISEYHDRMQDGIPAGMHEA